MDSEQLVTIEESSEAQAFSKHTDQKRLSIIT